MSGEGVAGSSPICMKEPAPRAAQSSSSVAGRQTALMMAPSASSTSAIDTMCSSIWRTHFCPSCAGGRRGLVHARALYPNAPCEEQCECTHAHARHRMKGARDAGAGDGPAHVLAPSRAAPATSQSRAAGWPSACPHHGARRPRRAPRVRTTPSPAPGLGSLQRPAYMPHAWARQRARRSPSA